MLELYELTKAAMKILTGLQEICSKIENGTSQY